MNRFRVLTTLATAVVLLCQFLLQPDQIDVWGDPKVAGVVLGSIAVIANVIQGGLPSWFQAPQAEAAMRRQERPGGPEDRRPVEHRHPDEGGDLAV